MNNMLTFLKNLQSNNNREWFNAHKNEYEIAKKEFEALCNEVILKIAAFDSPIGKVSVKECVFRIHRDIRFSPDKTPYKTHFGAYISFPGGRKSPRGGYYLHIDPKEGSFFGAGVWSPAPPILKALRQSIYENYDEFEEITGDKAFKSLYKDSFYQQDKLKKLPAGFSSDFADPEILKLKHYFVAHNFTEPDLKNENFTSIIANYAQTAYPLLRFFNYTIDEVTA